MLAKPLAMEFAVNRFVLLKLMTPALLKTRVGVFFMSIVTDFP
jgi:hypothetical protein